MSIIRSCYKIEVNQAMLRFVDITGFETVVSVKVLTQI